MDGNKMAEKLLTLVIRLTGIGYFIGAAEMMTYLMEERIRFSMANTHTQFLAIRVTLQVLVGAVFFFNSGMIYRLIARGIAGTESEESKDMPNTPSDGTR